MLAVVMKMILKCLRVCQHHSVSVILTGILNPTLVPTSEALPGVLGIQGEGLFIFRDLGRRVIYFQGFGEKAAA